MTNTILLIATSLISGLLATVITLIVQSKIQKKQAKHKIFENLMSYRYALHLQESVNELNKIDVIFYDNENVIKAWKEFKAEALRAGKDTDNPNMLQDKQLKILEEMAKVLGYKKINWVEIKEFYYPKGLADKIQTEAIINTKELENTISSNSNQKSTQLSMEQQMGIEIIKEVIQHPESAGAIMALADKFAKKPENK